MIDSNKERNEDMEWEVSARLIEAMDSLDITELEVEIRSDLGRTEIYRVRSDDNSVPADLHDLAVRVACEENWADGEITLITIDLDEMEVRKVTGPADDHQLYKATYSLTVVG